MADELSLQIGFSEVKNGVTFTLSFNDTFDVAGDTPISAVQSIGTADETLSLGEISTLGYMIAKNTDATNFVEIGHTSGTYPIKLKAGEFCAFRVGSGMTAIHAKSDTAACLLQYLLLPN
jgi:hypothetical protein